ncbi:A-kinase-interacting protein 1 [Falco biarmicus]|uniref:A-kinase-interacting protein 1 n=1 Tax=Falco peregrinus TaxID=8954 RepID=UPI002479C585|nr:A-kinase-interacting protein 1 [Falco peregrinus]XP_056210538.1 A-kinase-interacting protein 1 [Falco biarmicus]
MEGARAGRTAGLARDVLERARRRRRRPAGRLPASGPEEDSERLSAAFASIVNLMNQATRECEKYYSFMAACRCKEHEIKHICRYHGRQAGERELESSEEEGPEASVAPSQARTCQRHSRQASEDIYIEVSPGTYSVTATSEDMVQQTHVVDVNAGQSIDLTFVL